MRLSGNRKGGWKGSSYSVWCDQILSLSNTLVFQGRRGRSTRLPKASVLINASVAIRLAKGGTSAAPINATHTIIRSSFIRLPLQR